MLLHLTAGRGPAECEFAVGKFLLVLEQEINAEILAKEEGRFIGCLKSALIRTNKNISPLNGTVQWICKSPFRPHHKRKNWFIGIRQIDEPKNYEYETANGGIIYQTFCSSGKGGQHANKTETAVRAVHIATGLAAIAGDERSQYQNKKIAYERLNILIKKIKEERFLEEKDILFMNHNTLLRGNPIRIYEGINFKRFK